MAPSLQRILGRCTVPAVALALVACATAPHSTAPGKSATADAPAHSLPPNPNPGPGPIIARLTPEQATDVTLYAVSLVGTPYTYGGNTPESGFDCSGLIAYVYKSRAGLRAPRTVQALNDWGTALPLAQLQSGDLVLFSTRGVPTHAGIYVGEGRFVHAPSSGGDVRLDALTSGYWSNQPASYRRP